MSWQLVLVLAVLVLLALDALCPSSRRACACVTRDRLATRPYIRKRTLWGA
jgi:hypothetical protein